MAFETKPARLVGIWTTTYMVGGGKVSQKNVFGGETKQVSLPKTGVNVSIDRGGFPKNLLKRLFFDTGDVTVSIPGRSETYPDAMLAGAFRDAIFKEGKRAAQERYDHENPWYKGAELENFAIEIPRPPVAIQNIKAGKYMFQTKDTLERKTGDWVRKGDLVANVGGPIYAPCDGQIHHTSYAMASMEWDEKTNWPRNSGGGHAHFYNEIMHNVLFTIRPVKGQDLRPVMVNAYSQYLIQAGDALHRARGMNAKEIEKNYSFRPGFTMDDLIQHASRQIEALRRAQPRFIPATPINPNDERLVADVLIQPSQTGHSFDADLS